MSERRLPRWMAWQILGLGVVLLAPSRYWMSRMPWQAPADVERQIWALVGSYGVAIVLIAGVWWRRREMALPSAGFLLAACLSGGYLRLLLHPGEYYRTILVASTALSAFFVAFPLLVRRLAKPWEGALSALVVAGLLAGLGMVSLKRSDPVRVRVLFTNEYSLEARSFEELTPHAPLGGGGLTAIGGGFLLASGGGEFLLGRLEEAGELDLRRLEIEPPYFGEFTPETAPEVVPRRMRVNDVEVVPTTKGALLLASHFFWNLNEHCRTVRLSALEIRSAADPTPLPDAAWQVLHEARPCARFGAGGDPWNFLMTGGRILPQGDGRILFTVGNPTHALLSQDPESNLGRALIINVETGLVEEFSRGHRNSQGLARDAQGRIWSTEHGPKGGDELNLLRQGANYGWPVRTHGVEYLTSAYGTYGDVDLGVEPVEPVHAWVPSIGISNLIVLDSDRMPAWRGDLLIASLRAHSLFRVRLQDDRVAFVEPIEIGLRIRDLLQTDDGRVLLWTDEGTLVEISAPPPDASRELLSDCLSCHTWELGDNATATAPPLKGIYGRRVGSVEGFEYSDYLGTMRGEWSAERLDAFIRDPNGIAPGTTMQFPGVADPVVRAGIIRYLQENG